MGPLVPDNSPCRDDQDGTGDQSLPDGFPIAPVMIMNGSSSDSEEDDIPEQGGYALLSQTEPDFEAGSIHHFTSVFMEQEFLPWPENECDSTATEGSEPLPNEEPSMNRRSPSPKDIIMDEEHIEKIKQAMSGFTLPSGAFPLWAKEVPEHQWKDHLLDLMSSRNCPSSGVLLRKDNEEPQTFSPSICSENMSDVVP